MSSKWLRVDAVAVAAALCGSATASAQARECPIVGPFAPDGPATGWILVGWETKAGDGPLDFRAKLGRFYDWTPRLIPPHATTATPPTPQNHPHLGLWVTEDGHIRHELLPSGRYDEQRGYRKSAYVGKYWVQGNRIEYLDDTGFTADGEFRDGVFHHGGYVFRREGR